MGQSHRKNLMRLWGTVPGSYVACGIAYIVFPFAVGYDTLKRTCKYAKMGWINGLRTARHEFEQMKKWATPSQIRTNCKDRLEELK